VKNHRLLV